MKSQLKSAFLSQLVQEIFLFTGTRPRFSGSQDYVVLDAYDVEKDPLAFKVKGDAEQSYLTVDKNTGVVKLQKPFDREVK